MRRTLWIALVLMVLPGTAHASSRTEVVEYVAPTTVAASSLEAIDREGPLVGVYACTAPVTAGAACLDVMPGETSLHVSLADRLSTPVPAYHSVRRAEGPVEFTPFCGAATMDVTDAREVVILFPVEPDAASCGGIATSGTMTATFS